MIDVDKFTSSAASAVSDSELKSVAESIAKKCAQEANEAAKGIVIFPIHVYVFPVKIEMGIACSQKGRR